jgi:hypothetical protein
MIESVHYAALLRPIGQMLEALRIDSFALKLDSVGFIIRDKTRNRAQLTPRERAFLAQLHLSHAASLDKKDALQLATGILEWHLTPSDIGRLEQEGRERRRATKQAPDSHSISQILRVIGSMLDQKGGRMCYVSKEEQIVTVEYALPDGKKTTEKYSVPLLYDQWVRMYKKRAADRRSDSSLTV